MDRSHTINTRSQKLSVNAYDDRLILVSRHHTSIYDVADGSKETLTEPAASAARCSDYIIVCADMIFREGKAIVIAMPIVRFCPIAQPTSALGGNRKLPQSPAG
jgi:hypothetical protein